MTLGCSMNANKLLNANDQLRRGDAGTLLVINETTGERAEFPLVFGS